MHRIALTLFSCSLVFSFGGLQAQEVASKNVKEVVEQTAELDNALDTADKATADSSVLDGPEEDVVERVAMADRSVAAGEAAEEVDDQNETTVGEMFEGPAVVSVNAQGELIGMASADVSGESVPIEANISLVSGGVLIGKAVANEDGSFSFPNVLPGDYKVFGCASSYCGQRDCTVVSKGNCCDVVNVQLDQESVCGCDGGFASAPAASFGNNAGGFASGTSYSSGTSFGGGGFGGGGAGSAAGGGRLIGTRAFRLLAIGGIATAIAVGASDDDDVSPSE